MNESDYQLCYQLLIYEQRPWHSDYALSVILFILLLLLVVLVFTLNKVVLMRSKLKIRNDLTVGTSDGFIKGSEEDIQKEATIRAELLKEKP